MDKAQTATNPWAPVWGGAEELLGLHMPSLLSAHSLTVMKELNEVFQCCHTATNGY